MQGMIFAAGIGSRLKPFTDHHPKALVEVGGQPMLERVIRNMENAGIRHIVINVHHFAQQIIDYISSNDWNADIRISDETTLLADTGGGIGKAAPLLLPDEPVLLHNADIYTDLNLREFISDYNSTDFDALLAVSARNSSRMLFFDNSMMLKGWQNLKTGETRPDGFAPATNHTPLAFSGIHIISPKIVRMLEVMAKQMLVFSITPFYVANANQLNIKGLRIPEDTAWFDVGKPETLAAARQFAKSLHP